MIDSMRWKQTRSFPAIANMLSTQERQPIGPDQWPLWAQSRLDFSGLWLTPLDAPWSMSTGLLSSGTAQAYVEIERIAPGSTAPFRYYGFYYCRLADGRLFQSEPLKQHLGYERHREDRAPWFGPYAYRSTST